MVDSFDYSSVVPTSERVLAVDNIALFECHAPFKVSGLRHVRCNFERMAINGDGPLVNVVEVLDFKVGLVDCKYFASAPDEFIILAI